MKKERILYLMERLSMPVLLCLLGLVLLFTPDTASALVGKVAATGLLVVGILYAADGLFTRLDLGRKLTSGLLCLAGGIWLLSDPLVLAAWIGRIVGIAFILRGLDNLSQAQRMGLSRTWPLVTTLAGVLLVLSPMVTSRLVLKTFGLVLAIVGGVLIATRINQQKRLDGPQDPNIIDV